MGANDDGGEGFNSRLFLVNFPAREYVIMASGSPNPTPVGTFTISLTDVSEDDCPADATMLGEVVVGGSAPGFLEAPGDVDWFSVQLTAQTDYEIEVRGAANGAATPGQPTVVEIYNSMGLPHVTAENYVPNNAVEFSPPTDGIFYVAVTSAPFSPYRSTLPAGASDLSVIANS